MSGLNLRGLIGRVVADVRKVDDHATDVIREDGKTYRIQALPADDPERAPLLVVTTSEYRPLPGWPEPPLLGRAFVCVPVEDAEKAAELRAELELASDEARDVVGLALEEFLGTIADQLRQERDDAAA
jgi:hypothetical protein